MADQGLLIQLSSALLAQMTMRILRQNTLHTAVPQGQAVVVSTGVFEDQTGTEHQILPVVSEDQTATEECSNPTVSYDQLGAGTASGKRVVGR